MKYKKENVGHTRCLTSVRNFQFGNLRTLLFEELEITNVKNRHNGKKDREWEGVRLLLSAFMLLSRKVQGKPCLKKGSSPIDSWAENWTTSNSFWQSVSSQQENQPAITRWVWLNFLHQQAQKEVQADGRALQDAKHRKIFSGTFQKTTWDPWAQS